MLQQIKCEWKKEIFRYIASVLKKRKPRLKCFFFLPSLSFIFVWTKIIILEILFNFSFLCPPFFKLYIFIFSPHSPEKLHHVLLLANFMKYRCFNTVLHLFKKLCGEYKKMKYKINIHDLWNIFLCIRVFRAVFYHHICSTLFLLLHIAEELLRAFQKFSGKITRRMICCARGE